MSGEVRDAAFLVRSDGTAVLALPAADGFPLAKVIFRLDSAVVASLEADRAEESLSEEDAVEHHSAFMLSKRSLPFSPIDGP